MRRHDKKKHMEKVNILFEARKLKESAFNWNGKYENEEEIEEGIFLGNDMESTEYIDENEEEGCDCPLSEDENTTQWFSDEDGERLIDKNFN